jgi:hypothetical protein
MDLRPNRPLRKQFDYSDNAMLLLPPGVSRPEPKRRTLMSVECPRCRYRFSAPREYQMAICAADTPPHVGENRGCGWLLGVEPPYASGTVGRAFAVIDLYVHPATGQVPNKRFYIEGWRRIVQNWESRGLAKVERDSEGSVIGLKMPSVDELPDPSEN